MHNGGIEMGVMTLRDKWRLIFDPPLPGMENMSRDLEIMDEVVKNLSPPTLRFFTWDRPTLSVGYFQQPEEVADMAACKKLGIDIVRRPTGGRALLHNRELTYSIVVPEKYPLIPAGVLPSYKFFSKAIVKGLQALGVEAELAPGFNRGQGLAPGACFDTPSAYEIQVKEKKVVGSAQLRRGGCLLQHGSILLELSLELYRQVLKSTDSEKKEDYMSELGQRAAGLSDLGYKLCIDEIYNALSKSFSELLAVDFVCHEIGE